VEVGNHMVQVEGLRRVLAVVVVGRVAVGEELVRS